ncbi:MAG: hypothetical protein L6R37_003783 [Teloschistes peruensis]|nr:MAG: hypothetical protein L6R37_003783 [Teloschistes peruensis]
MEISDTTVGFCRDEFDPFLLPDFSQGFIDSADVEEFARALSARESSPLVALNDWRPVHQRVRRRSRRKKPKRSKDETREGFLYNVLKWPFLFVVLSWILALSVAYSFTRFYIWSYERLVTWRGRRQSLRKNLQSKTDFAQWKIAAEELDVFLGNERWKSIDEYAYYDHATVARVNDQLKSAKLQAQEQKGKALSEATNHLRTLVEACVKNNAFGVENPRLYSETYYGTKQLAQSFIDELYDSLHFLLRNSILDEAEKYSLARHLNTNVGRTALCLSGGATFAYYHFGVVKALVDRSLLPDVITGTSGGALVAALVSTRTDSELKSLLVPALAHKIKACQDGFMTWSPRWWRTGARFDSLEWARHCSWFCRGSTTFREAYARTGRILNVSCVPSDPHSPTILANYLTAPDCVIWSAVLASAAVPGILILKHLELLPRPLGQDWSGVWLQQFSGTITIWPKIRLSDFYYLLSDPNPERLAYMIRAGQRSTFPKLLFIENRMKIERLIEEGLLHAKHRRPSDAPSQMGDSPHMHGQAMRTMATSAALSYSTDDLEPDRRSSVLDELRRQGGVFVDDAEIDGDDTDFSENGTNNGINDGASAES